MAAGLVTSWPCHEWGNMYFSKLESDNGDLRCGTLWDWADQRALVENAAAFGLTQADSAEQLKIDEKTLRKHFRDELFKSEAKAICRRRILHLQLLIGLDSCAPQSGVSKIN